MPVLSAPSSLRGWLSRLVSIPTAFHLLCAERELRAADTRRLPAALREARELNLGLLREYRLRSEFPHNDHEPARPAPCFIDADGRLCAVAYLMHATGAREAALAVSREANHARVMDMRSPALEAWAGASGLTKAELARIQPSYPPTVEQVQQYNDFVRIIWAVGALGVLSILLNAACCLRVQALRYPAALVGFVLGVVCLHYHYRIETPQFGMTQLQYEAEALRTNAYWIGVASITCAVFQLVYGLGRGKPPAGPGLGTGSVKEE